MKLFIKEYSTNFQEGAKQVFAYFKYSSKEAQTLILQHIDPNYTSPANNASDILKVLDQRFFNHNRVQSARLAYYKLKIGSITYNDFRVKFTQLAGTKKINTKRQFKDLYEKISPALKRDIRTEKYKINGDYNTLDEFLAIYNRETRNIKAKELTSRPQAGISLDPQGILKISSWRALSPTPIVSDIDRKVTFRGTITHPRPPSPIPAVPVSSKTTANSPCNSYGKLGHWANDYPQKRVQQALKKKISEIVVREDIETNELSENS